MTDALTARWRVLDRYLALVVGSHRWPGWSLGPSREAAFQGVWDELAVELLPSETIRVVTDSNVNSACVYELDDDRTVYLSTVLPVFIAWDGARGGFLADAPAWAARLIEAGFTSVGAVATRTLTPYRDDEAGRRLTYFEMLFEWTEGSDGPDEVTLIDPWRPAGRTPQPGETAVRGEAPG